MIYLAFKSLIIIELKMTVEQKRLITAYEAKELGDSYEFKEKNTLGPNYYPDKYVSSGRGTFYRHSFNESDTSEILIYCNKDLDDAGIIDLFEKWKSKYN